MTSLLEREDDVTHVPAPPRRPRNRNAKLALLLILPAVAVELLVHIIPMLTGVATSVLGLDQFSIRDWSSAPFVGLDNYLTALNPLSPVGRALLTSMAVTLGLTVLVLLVAWPLGMGAALLVEDRFRRSRALFRTLFVLPFVIPAYVGAIAWRFMFQRDGVINNGLESLGLIQDKPFWLVGEFAPVAYVITLVWSIWPFAFLYLMAGLQTIPVERYEAAALDGAGPWGRFIHVTLPALRPINSILILLLFLWTFNNFTTAFSLFGSAPPAIVDVLPVHVFRTAFSTLNYGLGAAMSVVTLCVLLVITAIYWRSFRLGDSDDS